MNKVSKMDSSHCIKLKSYRFTNLSAFMMAFANDFETCILRRKRFEIKSRTLDGSQAHAL